MRGTMTRQLFAAIVFVSLVAAIGCTGTHGRRRLSHGAKPSNAASMDSIWEFRSLHSIGKVFESVEAW